MRQLVSIITDSSLSYFVHESDDDSTTQIAQLITPASLDVAAVITLGVNLIDALQLNGVPKRARAALPAAAESTPERRTAVAATQRRTHAAPSDVKAAEIVLCPSCHLGYRRSSLPQHLTRVHGWNSTKARLTTRTAPTAADDVVRSSRGGRRTPSEATPETVTSVRARRTPSELPPGVLWPTLNSDTIVEYVRAHPGCTSRDVAVSLADSSHRATKTVSNRCEQLAIKGRLRFDIEAIGNTRRRRYYVIEAP